MAGSESPFTPEEVPKGLEGLDAALIADLYDLVAKYGIDVRGVDGLRRLSALAPKEIHLSVTVPPSGFKNILISGWAGGANVSNAHFTMLKDGVHSFILWDKAFTVADIRAAIAAIDADMVVCRDPATGARMRTVSDRFSRTALKVDAVFDKKGKVILPVDDLDAEAFRQQFDRPDDVAVIPDAGGPGRAGLCRKADLARIARRDAVAAKVLGRRGITSSAQVERMSRAALDAMLAEIEAELDNDDN